MAAQNRPAKIALLGVPLMRCVHIIKPLTHGQPSFISFPCVVNILRIGIDNILPFRKKKDIVWSRLLNIDPVCRQKFHQSCIGWSEICGRIIHITRSGAMLKPSRQKCPKGNRRRTPQNGGKNYGDLVPGHLSAASGESCADDSMICYVTRPYRRGMKNSIDYNASWQATWQ